MYNFAIFCYMQRRLVLNESSPKAFVIK